MSIPSLHPLPCFSHFLASHFLGASPPSAARLAAAAVLPRRRRRARRRCCACCRTPPARARAAGRTPPAAAPSAAAAARPALPLSGARTDGHDLHEPCWCSRFAARAAARRPLALVRLAARLRTAAAAARPRTVELDGHGRGSLHELLLAIELDDRRELVVAERRGANAAAGCGAVVLPPTLVLAAARPAPLVRGRIVRRRRSAARCGAVVLPRRSCSPRHCPRRLSAAAPPPSPLGRARRAGRAREHEAHARHTRGTRAA